MKIENSDLLLFVPIRHLKLWDASTITNTIGSTNRAVHREFFGPTWRAAHSGCVALWLCVSCDFAVAVIAMIVVMYTGMTASFGRVPAPWSWAANLLLVLQFPLGHSLLLSKTGAQNNIVVCQKRACGDVADNDFCNAGISST